MIRLECLLADCWRYSLKKKKKEQKEDIEQPKPKLVMYEEIDPTGTVALCFDYGDVRLGHLYHCDRPNTPYAVYRVDMRDSAYVGCIQEAELWFLQRKESILLAYNYPAVLSCEPAYMRWN